MHKLNPGMCAVEGWRWQGNGRKVVDTDTLQWSTASGLPHPLTNTTAAVCGHKAI